MSWQVIGATGAPPLDQTDDTTATTEEEQLVLQLEAPTDDDEDGDDNDGGDDGNECSLIHPSSWPALQYAAYMTGTYQFVKEKHRAQGYLAEELARAEREMYAEGRVGPVKRSTLEVHYSSTGV